ncbi:MAG TPA: branched-chain amino acid ABC transporter permease [Geminicoccaceae bacterium]|nr:branched-chain amino acid ABC transporter permease [Geminicoccaceae bacterium]
MDQAYGIFLYVVSLLTVGGIYAVLALGLNIQWGFTGLFNAGIAGFFAVGAYVAAILTTGPSERHLGGLDLPVAAGLAAAMLASGLVAWGIGRICIRLRSDYLAIATLGIAEILRLMLKNETWATNGARGISLIPKPFENLQEPWNQLAFMGLVLAFVALLYVLLEQARRAPWGRLMAAIRENEAAARAAGKDVDRLRVQAFVIGSMLMGLGGALMAHYLKFIDPNAAEPLTATFLVWVMLIAGGSANNRGAILGALLVWTIWSATEILTTRLPDDLAIRTAYVRVFLIGLTLQIVLQRFPRGVLPERRMTTGAGRDQAPKPARRSDAVT